MLHEPQKERGITIAYNAKSIEVDVSKAMYDKSARTGAIKHIAARTHRSTDLSMYLNVLEAVTLVSVCPPSSPAIVETMRRNHREYVAGVNIDGTTTPGYTISVGPTAVYPPNETDKKAVTAILTTLAEHVNNNTLNTTGMDPELTVKRLHTVEQLLRHTRSDITEKSSGLPTGNKNAAADYIPEQILDALSASGKLGQIRETLTQEYQATREKTQKNPAVSTLMRQAFDQYPSARSGNALAELATIMNTLRTPEEWIDYIETAMVVAFFQGNDRDQVIQMLHDNPNPAVYQYQALNPVVLSAELLNAIQPPPLRKIPVISNNFNLISGNIEEHAISPTSLRFSEREALVRRFLLLKDLTTTVAQNELEATQFSESNQQHTNLTTIPEKFFQLFRTGGLLSSSIETLAHEQLQFSAEAMELLSQSQNQSLNRLMRTEYRTRFATHALQTLEQEGHFLSLSAIEGLTPDEITGRLAKAIDTTRPEHQTAVSESFIQYLFTELHFAGDAVPASTKKYYQKIREWQTWMATHLLSGKQAPESFRALTKVVEPEWLLNVTAGIAEDHLLPFASPEVQGKLPPGPLLVPNQTMEIAYAMAAEQLPEKIILLAARRGHLEIASYLFQSILSFYAPQNLGNALQLREELLQKILLENHATAGKLPSQGEITDIIERFKGTDFLLNSTTSLSQDNKDRQQLWEETIPNIGYLPWDKQVKIISDIQFNPEDPRDVYTQYGPYGASIEFFQIDAFGAHNPFENLGALVEFDMGTGGEKIPLLFTQQRIADGSMRIQVIPLTQPNTIDIGLINHLQSAVVETLNHLLVPVIPERTERRAKRQKVNAVPETNRQVPTAPKKPATLIPRFAKIDRQNKLIPLERATATQLHRERRRPIYHPVPLHDHRFPGARKTWLLWLEYQKAMKNSSLRSELAQKIVDESESIKVPRSLEGKILQIIRLDDGREIFVGWKMNTYNRGGHDGEEKPVEIHISYTSHGVGRMKERMLTRMTRGNPSQQSE